VNVSLLSPLQIALQNQIEALQQQQQQLLQQQIASNQVMSSAFGAPQLGGGIRPAGHRRIQSTQVPMGMGAAGMNQFSGNFGGMPNANFNLGGMGVGGMDQQGSLGVPRGHGRRHSVNVINKSTNDPGQGSSPSFAPSNLDGYDDGFVAPQAGGHSRQASRADPAWRMSKHVPWRLFFKPSSHFASR
jgi:protein SSD1